MHAQTEMLGFERNGPSPTGPIPTRAELVTTPCMECGVPVVDALDQDGQPVALDPGPRVFMGLVKRRSDGRVVVALTSNGCAEHRCRSTRKES